MGSRATYVKNPPFTVFRITPLPKIADGEEQENSGVNGPLLPGEAYTWEDAEGLHSDDTSPLDQSTSSVGDAAEIDETAPSPPIARSIGSLSTHKETLFDDSFNGQSNWRKC